MKNSYRILIDDNRSKAVVIFKSLIVGVLSGAVVVFYRIVLSKAEEASLYSYGFLRKNIMYLPLAILVVMLIALIIKVLVTHNRMISGSGIPQIVGILKGHFGNRKSWFTTILGKFAGGTLGILGGLSLGREGPSIQLGSLVAEGIGKKTTKSGFEKKLLMACGASAGLAAAFNAPVAGVVFVIEEIYKYFSPIILISAMTSAVAADFVSKNIFGLEPIFHFEIEVFPLEKYWILILVGIILGVFGAFYNYILLKVQLIYSKNNFLSKWGKYIIPFVIAIILGIYFPIVLGSGHEIIEILDPKNSLIFLVIVFVVKFLFSVLSFTSGTPGGIFFPLLILGATLGGFFGNISSTFFGVGNEFFYNFVVFAMVGYFTAIVRAPITGIILITEMTGSFSNMLPLTMIAIISYVVADRLKSPPIYEALLERMLEKEHPEEIEEYSRKVFIELLVTHDSSFDHSKVRDVNWPEKSVLIGIKRGNRELVPRGETVLKSGDYLMIITDKKHEFDARVKLCEMNQYDR